MNFERPIHIDRETSALWAKYYTGRSRTGSGIPGYYGENYQQQGYGWFGNLFKRFALPVVKYLGKKAATTLVRAGGDAIAGDNFLDSLKTRSKETAKDIVGDASDRASQFIQTGKGRFRRKHRKRRGKRRTRHQKLINRSKVKSKKSNKRRTRRRRSSKKQFTKQTQNLFY
jgi:hypothetical protein